MTTQYNSLERMKEWTVNFFVSWRLPSFLLLTSFFFWILIMGIALIPVSETPLGQFALDFKTWCFGYDPATGSMEYMYLVGYTIQPIVLGLVIWFVWKDSLAEISKTPRLLKGTAFSSATLVIVLGITFTTFNQPANEQSFEFDAVALRTQIPFPEFSLVNAEEQKVSNTDFENKVVIMTSIYTSCVDTCPLIVDQFRGVLDQLSPYELDEVVLVIVTMQPEKDRPELLSIMSRYYRLHQYPHHFLTGDPPDVHALLDRVGVARKVNEDTGEISHVNLFLIRDRKGKIAYRFSLGEYQEEWMLAAVRTLIHE